MKNSSQKPDLPFINRGTLSGGQVIGAEPLPEREVSSLSPSSRGGPTARPKNSEGTSAKTC